MDYYRTFPPNCYVPTMNSFIPSMVPNWQWPVPDKENNSQRHKFSKAEDDLLRKLVEKYGETNWMAVSSQMKTRTPRQCRERFKNYLSSKIKNGPWTLEEEKLLEEKVKELGQRWAKIALFFESRSDVNVKNHWAALVNRQIREKQSALLKEKALQEVTIEEKVNETYNTSELFNSSNTQSSSSFWGNTSTVDWQPESISTFLGDSMVDFFL